MTFAEIADELYDLHPTAFTAARNVAAAGSPDRERIMALKKPTPAAWLVNLLVRQRHDEVSAALQLGEQLRAAQADLDRESLAELTRQRRQLVNALAKQGAGLAEVQGHKVSASTVEEVAQTLQAAMVDPDAAAAVSTGRLVRPLEAVGLTVDVDNAVAGDSAPRTRAAHPVDELEEKRAERRRRTAEAQRELEAAETAHQKAERRVADAIRARDAVAEQLDDAQERVKAIKRTLADAEKALKAASQDRDEAARGREAAQRDLTDL